MNRNITENIKENLAVQLLHYSELPFKLTLVSIAEFYSVSLTPVRQAISELVDENILVRKENGRLERANPPKHDIAIKESLEITSTVNAGNLLEEKVTIFIVQLSLKNHSEYIREEATAKKFDTGRTIMRQIFSRLEGAGFLQHVPRCGWKVRSLREKDMSDYLEIREILEVKALRLARPFFSKSELKSLLEGNIASNDPLLVSLNNDLHNYWISRCDNRYIQDFFNRHGSFYTAVFEYVALEETVMKEMAQEHRDVLQNLLDENWQLAEQALITHIRDQKHNLLNHKSFKSLIRNG